MLAVISPHLDRMNFFGNRPNDERSNRPGRELCIFAKMLYLNSCNARDLTQKALGHYYYC